MKSIKLIAVALLLGCSLFMAAQAQAYAIYNDTDKEVCINKWYNILNCHVTVGAHSKYNGEHGAGLDHVYASWSGSNQMCHTTNKFNIPKGGYIKIHDSEVKIYDHHDHHKKSMPVEEVPCPRLMGPKKD
ncbi:MAG: hypothetical protein K9L19_09100 [Desulfarculaceae bacterium]|nr:hypothetical protein [Desulfarculaceae bacterium]MCF8047686.1 hypothetical protein [Desulfarculaceae bacterium]MCF8121710.1 hypothetical protein [Desulfarculaceae bacterium]